MPDHGDLNDDKYIAELLAEDARKSSIRYSSMGMSALLPKRPTNAAPKPNTRFLKTLVREADSHNAALKKKEELEARIRLRNIREKESSTKPDHLHESDSKRGHGHERPTKRRRLSDDHDRPRSDHHRRSRHERRRNSSSDRSRSPEPNHRDKPRHHDSDSNDSHRRSKHRKSSSYNHRPRSHDRREHGRDRGKHSHTSKPRRHGSHSDGEALHQEVSQPRIRDDHKHRRSPSMSSTSTASDPLASLIGPIPPKKDPTTTLRKRGRGFHKAQYQGTTSNIDHHFSSAYDPSRDASGAASPDGVAPDDDEDWDNALEALRDRRAWRDKQAERMREAGFGDEEIERWEKSAATRRGLPGGGGSEADSRDIRDVKWRKRGEEKEWDSGKVRLGNLDDGADDDYDDEDDIKADDHRREISRSRLKGNNNNTPSVKDKNRPPASASTSARAKSSAEGNLDDVWQRKDSGFVKQFRRALG